ncbi:adenine phosphoribosyltransferase [Leeuwenhoekiella parthenopeia]|uniref:Adenine phosphoribosyltransferase n=1 Tax=Leeuwenhoekiella parthenopeia TaxID=2890320 RepID=A0ABS8GR18_9FLAO|nr:adenine phosphoribosyltransferase [Leeuwenhoekiella parthenopeia]MCC4212427.1 adenine phosphoribosyltransferase [Leeuwenhoekiella parthenopeia]
MDLKNYITDVPDFPKEGIVFKDISPLLVNARATNYAVELLAKGLYDIKATKVIGIESRGFLFGSLLAQKLGLGFVPVRKPGKLPGKILSESYDLEYGTDSLEIKAESIAEGDLVIVHDDVLATGGTAAAACRLVEHCGGKVVQCNFLMELDFLNGRKKLSSYSLHSLLHY